MKSIGHAAEVLLVGRIQKACLQSNQLRDISKIVDIFEQVEFFSDLNRALQVDETTGEEFIQLIEQLGK